MSTTALRMSVFSAIDDALRDDREEKVLCCRILARLLVADGSLDPRERALLEATVARHGLDGEHQARIWAELDGAASDGTEPLGALLDRLPTTALTELEQYLEWGAWADGQVLPAEQTILDTVRARLARAR